MHSESLEKLAKSFNRGPIGAEISFDIHFCCRLSRREHREWKTNGKQQQTNNANNIFFDILVTIDSAARDNVLLLRKIFCLCSFESTRKEAEGKQIKSPSDSGRKNEMDKNQKFFKLSRHEIGWILRV